MLRPPTADPVELTVPELADLHEAFELYDVDGSGSVAAEELKDLLHWAGSSESLAPYVLQQYDRDESGCLSYDEMQIFLSQIKGYLKHCLNALQQLFLDQDVLSLESLQGALAEEEGSLGLPEGLLQGLVTQRAGEREELTREEVQALMLGRADKNLRVERSAKVCKGAKIDEIEYDPEEDDTLAAHPNPAEAEGDDVASIVARFEATFGFEFLWQGEGWTNTTIEGTALSEEEVTSALDENNPTSLYNVFALLPSSFHEKRCLKKLVLAHSLTTRGQPVGGMGGASCIWLNFDCMWAIKSIVLHEMYHCIDGNDNQINDARNRAWRSTNPPDFKYNNEKGGYGNLSQYGLRVGSGPPGFVSGYSVASIMEDKAVLFEKWMCQRKKVVRLAQDTGEDGGVTIVRKLKILFEELEGFDEGFNGEYLGLAQLPEELLGAAQGAADAEVAQEEEAAAALEEQATQEGREEKAGFLVAGGNFAVADSIAEATKLVLANRDKVMGFTYRNGDPSCCWVKEHGTGFAESDNWTTVLFPTVEGAATPEEVAEEEAVQEVSSQRGEVSSQRGASSEVGENENDENNDGADSGLPKREEKSGYLTQGGNFAVVGSIEEATKITLANLDQVMGFTYRVENPNCCWVKRHGTGFADSNSWVTVLYTERFDPTDIEKLKEQFAELDTNGDGTIDPEEIAELLTMLSPENFDEEATHELVAAMDVDGNGRIDIAEFITWVFKTGGNLETA